MDEEFRVYYEYVLSMELNPRDIRDQITLLCIFLWHDLTLQVGVRKSIYHGYVFFITIVKCLKVYVVFVEVRIARVSRQRLDVSLSLVDN